MKLSTHPNRASNFKNWIGVLSIMALTQVAGQIRAQTTSGPFADKIDVESTNLNLSRNDSLGNVLEKNGYDKTKVQKFRYPPKYNKDSTIFIQNILNYIPQGISTVEKIKTGPNMNQEVITKEIIDNLPPDTFKKILAGFEKPKKFRPLTQPESM